MHTLTNSATLTYKHVWTSTHVYLYMYILYFSVYIHVRTCTCTLYIHVHVQSCMCMYPYICTGLEVHVDSKTFTYDYGWGAFNQSSPRPFQKMPITLHEATFQHYRLHKLTKDDSLKFFMSLMASIPATLAVVLINFDDTYELSEKFVSEEGEMPPVPVILVTNETGSRLLRLLEENPRDVEAVIHSQTPPSQPQEALPSHCMFGRYTVYSPACACMYMCTCTLFI